LCRGRAKGDSSGGKVNDDLQIEYRMSGAMASPLLKIRKRLSAVSGYGTN
jgi:hypothetical protein